MASRGIVDATQTRQAGEGEESEPGALQLLVIGKEAFSAHPLPRQGTTTVGRADVADIRVSDGLISRKHLALHLGSVLEVEDLASANGTRLGQVKLEPGRRSPLAIGEPIHLGSTILMVQRALRGAALSREQVAAPPVVIEDASMVRLYELVDRVAPGMINVLITGETGVGKDVVAEAIHRRSPRAKLPLLRLNCAALSETLLESEIFGHERGAFTGAVAAKAGLLETAQGGTVFFDEVGELPPGIQAKLLRVIETREVTRVGGLKPKSIDVRFVAATNRELESEIGRGSFRSDLFYRLNGFSLVVPPLRERTSEVASLSRAFVAQYWRLAGRDTPPPALSAEALVALQRYRWPGNIRELRNVIERATLLVTGGSITTEHLPMEKLQAAVALAGKRQPPRADAAQEAGVPERTARAETTGEVSERDLILEALERHAGNQTRAAKMLGISRRTLITRLEAYGIQRPRMPPPKA